MHRLIAALCRSFGGRLALLARGLRRLEGFLAARHVAVVGRGAREDMIDEWLRRHGCERQIAVVTPSYIQALHVAARSDLVAFVPRRLIGAVSRSLALQTIEPPLDPGVDEQFLFYPAQAETDPGSLWLRRHLLAVGGELEEQSSQRSHLGRRAARDN